MKQKTFALVATAMLCVPAAPASAAGPALALFAPWWLARHVVGAVTRLATLPLLAAAADQPAPGYAPPERYGYEPRGYYAPSPDVSSRSYYSPYVGPRAYYAPESGPRYYSPRYDSSRSAYYPATGSHYAYSPPPPVYYPRAPSYYSAPQIYHRTAPNYVRPQVYEPPRTYYPPRAAYATSSAAHVTYQAGGFGYRRR